VCGVSLGAESFLGNSETNSAVQASGLVLRNEAVCLGQIAEC